MANDTSLAVLDPTKYVLAKQDPAALREVLQANMGEGGLTPLDLDRVGAPSGGGIAWTIQTATGPQVVQEFVGVLVGQGDRRAYWSKPFGTGDVVPPDCSSDNAIIGHGNPGGPCRDCPHAQYGTKIGQDGKPGNGQACNARKFLFLIRENDRLPFIVSAPPASLKNAKQYLLRLSNEGKKLSHVVTRMRLDAKQEGSVKYSMITFEKVADLTPEMCATFDKVAEVFKPLMGVSSLTQRDVVSEQ